MCMYCGERSDGMKRGKGEIKGRGMKEVNGKDGIKKGHCNAPSVAKKEED